MLPTLDIPIEELQQFQPFLRPFTKGDVIVREGQASDQRFFLLRLGVVEVFKKIGDQQKSLGKIEAVNIFGEMSLLSHRPRSATIIADSESVILYAFDNPNLSAILGNPKWSLMLVRRLVDDLEQRHINLEAAQVKAEQLSNSIGNLVGSLLILYSASSRDEFSKNMFHDSMPRIIGEHISGLGIPLKLPDNNQLKHYQNLGIITEYLYRLAVATRAKMKE